MKAVLFDFDFTLADSSTGIVMCVDHALRAVGRPPVPREEVLPTIGLSLAEVFRRLGGGQDPHLAGEFARCFIAHADEVMAAHTRLYAGVAEVAARLRQAGLRLGIVSTKFRYRIEAALAENGLGGAFDTIVGGEDVAEHKPHPAALLLAAERLGVGPGECVYVGDHLVDEEAARGAGMGFVAVVTGCHGREAFAGCSARAVLDSLQELPAQLGLQDLTGK